MSNDKKPLVIGLGEVLWDLLPDGKQLGGAPANFAYHAKALGADAHVVSSVGDDALGGEILARLDWLGVQRQFVSVDHKHPTGTVSVELDGQGKATYIIHTGVAWDYIPPTPGLLETMRKADAVCFGSLAQRSEVSRATIEACLAATEEQCLRIFDVNLRQHYFNVEVIEAGLQAARVLKLNEEELPVVADLLGIAGEQEDILDALLKKFDLDLIALTRGEKGSLLVAPGQLSAQAAIVGKIIDTVGAGDAFTAALAIGLLQGRNLDAINRCAARLAGYVCSQSGATPEIPEEFTRCDTCKTSENHIIGDK